MIKSGEVAVLYCRRSSLRSRITRMTYYCTTEQRTANQLKVSGGLRTTTVGPACLGKCSPSLLSLSCVSSASRQEKINNGFCINIEYRLNLRLLNE
jgi:hypothetical protein